MSEELEEQYEEEGYEEQGDKGYFRKDGPKVDKTMLLAWGISVASATVILLIATLIVIAVMEEEEEPIEYAIAPATMMEEQGEQQLQNILLKTQKVQLMLLWLKLRKDTTLVSFQIFI